MISKPDQKIFCIARLSFEYGDLLDSNFFRPKKIVIGYVSFLFSTFRTIFYAISGNTIIMDGSPMIDDRSCKSRFGSLSTTFL